MTEKLIPYESELLNLLDAIRKLEGDFSIRRGFNIFDALNISKQEIRHSRFLAYLLDPRESHELGDRFLRGVLLAVSSGNPYTPVGRLALSIRDLRDATVYCERDNFDISVQIPSLGLIFVIENKVDSSEGDNQLKRYRERALERYSGYSFMGCFLTPDGYEGGDEEWGLLSYTRIVDEINSAIEDCSPPRDVLIALTHYVDLIERKIVTSQPLIDACRELYMAHKVAFDLVFEHGWQSTLGASFQDFAKENCGISSVVVRSDVVYFLDESWLKIPNSLIADKKRWHSQFPILFWFKLRDEKLRLCLEIGPIADQDSRCREKLVEIFRGEYGSRSTRPSGIFTRIVTLTGKVSSEPSTEEILGAMNELWRRMNSSNGAVQKVGELVEVWVSDASGA